MEYVDPIILKLQNEKGQLPPDYPHLGIQTLADPQHRCRNFGKEIIALARAPMKDSLLTEVQALRIIKAFKYWYRQSRVRDEVITQMKRYVPLMHMCADHSKCEIEWCYFLKAQLKGSTYQEPANNFHVVLNEREIEQVKIILDKYTSDERIREMLHGFDTQICEALNYLLTLFAPKHKNFSRTRSLEFRKSQVINIHNDGHQIYYAALLDMAGIEMTPVMSTFLFNITENKKKRQIRKENLEVKKIRAHGFATRNKEEIEKNRTGKCCYKTNSHLDKECQQTKI